MLLYIHQKYRKAPNVNTIRSFNKHFFFFFFAYLLFQNIYYKPKALKNLTGNTQKCFEKVKTGSEGRMLLLARNIKIVQDLQGAMSPLWRCHGNLLLENRYLCFNHHRRCAAIPFFFSLSHCGQIVGFIIRQVIRKRTTLACTSIPVCAGWKQQVDISRAHSAICITLCRVQWRLLEIKGCFYV